MTIAGLLRHIKARALASTDHECGLPEADGRPLEELKRAAGREWRFGVCSARMCVGRMPVLAWIPCAPELTVRRGGRTMLALNPGRRRWLFGRNAVREPSSSQARVATIATSCLAQHCVVCRSCGDECEEGAIRFHPSIGAVPMPVIDSSRCNGCGVCVPVCPAAAITIPAVAGSCVAGAPR